MTTYPPPSPPFIAARWHGGKQIPKAIVVHATVTPCKAGEAKAVAEFFAHNEAQTSAHYVVDPERVFQCVGDHTIAYHCGYNAGSLGVELCDPQSGPGTRWENAGHDAMLTRGARLVAQLCLAYGIAAKRPTVADLKAHGPHGIYGHNDSRLAFDHTTHTDPGPASPWQAFLDRVHDRIAVVQARAEHRYPNADAALAAADRGLAATDDPDREALWRKLRSIAVELGGRAS